MNVRPFPKQGEPTRVRPHDFEHAERCREELEAEKANIERWINWYQDQMDKARNLDILKYEMHKATLMIKGFDGQYRKADLPQQEKIDGQA